MTTTISKWGNSQGIRFSQDMMNDLHLAIGDKVNVFIENNKIIMEPIQKEKIKYDINELVSKIPKDYTVKEEITVMVGKEEY